MRSNKLSKQVLLRRTKKFFLTIGMSLLFTMIFSNCTKKSDCNIPGRNYYTGYFTYFEETKTIYSANGQNSAKINGIFVHDLDEDLVGDGIEHLICTTRVVKSGIPISYRNDMEEVRVGVTFLNDNISGSDGPTFPESLIAVGKFDCIEKID